MATAPPSADAVLVRRLRERDRTAWEELYEQYAPRLRPFAYRLTGNPSRRGRPRPGDVRPRAAAARPARPRDGRASGRTSSRRCATSSSSPSSAAGAPSRSADVPEPTTPAPIEDDPERSTLLRRQQEEVRVANARLAPRQRLVLALRELEDRSYAEIGVVVGLKENAVAQLISRARESLRTELRLAQVDPASLPEECRRFLPLLSRHLDGQLRGAAARDDARASRRLRALPGRAAVDAGGAAPLPRAAAAVLRRGRRALERSTLSSRPRGTGSRLAAGPGGARTGCSSPAHSALLIAGAGGVGAAVIASKGERSAAPAASHYRVWHQPEHARADDDRPRRPARPRRTS